MLPILMDWATHFPTMMFRLMEVSLHGLLSFSSKTLSLTLKAGQAQEGAIFTFSPTKLIVTAGGNNAHAA